MGNCRGVAVHQVKSSQLGRLEGIPRIVFQCLERLVAVPGSGVTEAEGPSGL